MIINRCFLPSITRLGNAGFWAYYGTRLSTHNQSILGKPITLEHINNSNSVRQLILDTEIVRVNQQKFYRQFIYKLTELLNKEARADEQVLLKFQQVIYEIRRYSSAELHANASDILNYALLFKKARQILPDNYRSEGFEHRASIVAENIPKIISLEGKNPKGIGLLHYYSITSNFSKVQLKNNIGSYLKRYYAHLSKNNNLQIEIDLPLIILSISDFTKNKIPIESELYEHCIYNICRRWNIYRSALNLSPLINKQSLSYINKDIKPSKQQLGIQQSWCINSKQNMVKICDLLCMRLKLQPIFKTTIDEISYQMTSNLINYLILLFKMSKDMEIDLKTNKNSKESIKLWKVAKEIMKSIEICSEGLEDINRLSTVILGEVLAFYQTDQLTTIKRNKIIRDNGKHILEIFYACSQHNIDQDYSTRLQANKTSKNIYYSLVMEITKKISSMSDYDDILEIIVNMYRSRVKVLSSKQWEKVLKQIIKQDEEGKFWKIYYLIAETKNPDLLKVLKFDDFIQRILKKKVFLIEKEKQSELLNEISNSNTQDNAARREIIYEINYYEANLLRTYGLALLTNNLSMLEKFGLLDEALGLLKKWVVPYNKFLMSQLTKTEGEEKKFEISKVQMMPFAFIGKFCKIMFDQTLCYKQQELVYQLLKMQQIKLWFLKNHNYKEINFFYYFKILLLGLNDSTHKKQIQEIYPIQIFQEYELRRTTFFQAKTLEVFNQIQCYEQMKYMLMIMKKFDAIHTGRDYYLLWNRKMRTKTLDKSDPVMMGKWRTFNKMILQELLLNLRNPNNTGNTKKVRLAFIANYLEYLGSQRANILDKELVKQIKNVLFDVKYEFEKAPVIFDFYYAFSKMGLLDKEAYERLLNQFEVPKTSFLYYAIRQNLGYQFDQLAKTFNSSFKKSRMNFEDIKFAIKYAQTPTQVSQLDQQRRKGSLRYLPSAKYSQLQEQLQKSCIRLKFKIEGSSQTPSTANVFRKKSPNNHK